MPARKTKDHGPTIADDRQYEALRRQGASKEKAARIVNAAVGSSKKAVARKGGKAADYDDRTVSELKKRAAEVGIEGRSKMNKSQLIDALRNN